LASGRERTAYEVQLRTYFCMSSFSVGRHTNAGTGGISA
jgi:hypothetical protein